MGRKTADQRIRVGLWLVLLRQNNPRTDGNSVSTTVVVKLFGRLHDDPIRTRRRQAYEKHQWTKSREAARLWCGELYEGLSGTPTLVVRDGTSREEVDGAFKRGMPLPVW